MTRELENNSFSEPEFQEAQKSLHCLANDVSNALGEWEDFQKSFVNRVQFELEKLRMLQQEKKCVKPLDTELNFDKRFSGYLDRYVLHEHDIETLKRIDNRLKMYAEKTCQTFDDEPIFIDSIVWIKDKKRIVNPFAIQVTEIKRRSVSSAVTVIGLFSDDSGKGTAEAFPSECFSSLDALEGKLPR